MFSFAISQVMWSTCGISSQVHYTYLYVLHLLLDQNLAKYTYMYMSCHWSQQTQVATVYLYSSMLTAGS